MSVSMVAVSPEISAKAASVKDANALVEILNEILQYNCTPLIPKIQHPITVAKLRFWANPDMSGYFIDTPSGKRRKGCRYYNFKIPKKSGGMREISTPAKPLKSLLRLVDAWLKCLITPADCVMGFVSQRSVMTNANRHLGANFVFNIDLKDFFPSISRQRLIHMFMGDQFAFSKEFASLLANLLVMKTFDTDGMARYVLPQGAPSSPAVTNAVCHSLDLRLTKLAETYGVKYTRYADDMTFSANYNAFAEGSPFRVRLDLIIEQSRFIVNEGKTRLSHKGERQEITGLILSDRINPPRCFMQGLREILYIWERYGYDVAVRNYVFERRLCKPKVLLEDSIYGRLMWVRNVKGKESTVYKRLLEKYRACMRLRAESLSKYFSNNHSEFINTLPVADFETVHNLKISLKKLQAKIPSTQDSFVKTQQQTLRGLASSTRGSFEIYVSKRAYHRPLSSMQISLCRNDSRGYYWILT